MNGQNLIAALKRKFRVRTDQELSNKLGVSIPGLNVTKNRSDQTPLQVANLVHSAWVHSAKTVELTTIRPLVEFYKIERCFTSHEVQYELFSESVNKKTHPYRAGLKKELKECKGIYVFFDSRGSAIYTGKAKQQNLWSEMKSAFNRKRSVQTIKKVRHPENRVGYKTSKEKIRQITDSAVKLHDMATYFSAYQVAEGMIDELEALLVRSFANDLLNVRVEKFGKMK